MSEQPLLPAEDYALAFELADDDVFPAFAEQLKAEPDELRREVSRIVQKRIEFLEQVADGGVCEI